MFRDSDEIKALEKAGVDHVTIWLNQGDGSGAMAEVEELAKQLLP